MYSISSFLASFVMITAAIPYTVASISARIYDEEELEMAKMCEKRNRPNFLYFCDIVLYCIN